MDRNEWERAKGVICPRCGEEALRVVDGVCSTCYAIEVAEKEELVEERTMRRYYRRKLAAGDISLRQMREGGL